MHVTEVQAYQCVPNVVANAHAGGEPRRGIAAGVGGVGCIYSWWSHFKFTKLGVRSPAYMQINLDTSMITRPP